MPKPVTISIRLPSTMPMSELMQIVQDVETAGFDGAGFLDSQMLCRDTFVTLAQAAIHTSRLKLFPAVTNPFARHASVLAGAAQTVAELAPGRTKCIVGTGYTSATTIGRKPATLAEMRTCITTAKKLLAGETVDFQGTPGRLGYWAGEKIPVLMAASGPKAIKLAGEIADGVLLLVGYVPGIIDAVLECLEQGARQGGRRLEDLEIVWAVRTGTADTMAEAQRRVRPIAVHWGIMGWGSRWLQHSGIEIPAFEIPQAVKEIYPDLSHAANWEEAIEATSFVPDEVVAQLCDALGLIGTPEHCMQRIMEMTEAGATNLYLMPSQTFAGPTHEIQSFGEIVFPRLQEEGYH